jgi:hypothetical protein
LPCLRFEGAKVLRICRRESRGGLAAKAKHAGVGKPFVEDMATPSFSVGRQKFVHRERVIDRENDRYFERVTDYETGETIHEVEEPLSQHTGHGNAKPKR